MDNKDLQNAFEQSTFYSESKQNVIRLTIPTVINDEHPCPSSIPNTDHPYTLDIMDERTPLPFSDHLKHLPGRLELGRAGGQRMQIYAREGFTNLFSRGGERGAPRGRVGNRQTDSERAGVTGHAHGGGPRGPGARANRHEWYE